MSSHALFDDRMLSLLVIINKPQTRTIAMTFVNTYIALECVLFDI